jgi:hypothetical protein
VSELLDDDGFDGKNWGSGEPEREGIGVDVAVHDTDERPDGRVGGNKKSEGGEPAEPGAEVRGLV